MPILRPLIVLFSIVCTSAFAQVDADFSASATSGCGSLQVTFFDQSTSSAGNIVSWSWNLGGVNSSIQNPGRIFGTPGLYTICLTATDNQGNSDTECKDGFIQVFNLPQPNFTASPTIGCSPLEVTFEDLTTTLDGDIVEWIWGVGGSNGVIIDDGSLPSITNTYILPDDYSVNLTVIDENNCTNTVTINDFISVLSPPDIEVSVNNAFSCTPPLSVSFSNDDPEPNTIYYWDLGNGQPVFQGNSPPDALYNQLGQYTITVIAENQLTSCSDTLELEGVVNVGLPVAFSMSQEGGCIYNAIQFFDESLVPADSVLWDFGDGNTSSETNPEYLYSQSGCYTVSLTRYFNGCVATDSTVECIDIYTAPDVSVDIQGINSCTVPHTIDYSWSANNNITSWEWDFGDGTTSTSTDSSHTYAEFGVYPVTLTISDESGCPNILTDTVRIIELEASMDFTGVSGCSPLSVTLSDNSTTVVPITSWQWWVDTSYTDPGTPLLVSTDAMPSFVLADTGYYDVQLIATNALGCTDTVYYSEAIGVGMTPVVNFEANPLESCAGDAIQFTDLSSDFVNEWLWEFGDSTFSTDQHPAHEYNSADTFDVTLIASHYGCFETLVLEDYVITIIPVGGFSVQRNCDNPYFIQFVDESDGADSIHWDFGLPEGELDTSILFNPVFLFPDTGCYIVTQTVFNDSTGCIDVEIVNVCIKDPVAAFALDTLAGCAPLTIDIIDQSVFAEQWDWVAPGGSVTADSTNFMLHYENPGTYSDIQLIVTDEFGCTDTTVFNENILVNGMTPAFSSDPIGGCSPLNVQFFDNSTSLFGNITNWQWQFGDSIFPSDIPNPEYLFVETGDYPVTLTVTDDWGCNSTMTFPDAIHATEPVPMFSGDTLGCTTAEMIFVNESTGLDLTYVWSFGDAATSTNENPMHQYATEGTYEVCLVVTDLYGCEKIYCREVVIADPVADFDLDETYSNCPPLLVNFTNLSQNATQFEWDFGDASGNSNLEHPPHVYTTPGTFDVTLIASSTNSCSDTLLIEELIVLEGPLGSFYFDIDTACVPATITFYGQSDDYYDYIWDFGNGELDTVFNVIADTTVHVFTETGVFFPNLILINTTNCQRAIESPIPIVLYGLDVDFLVLDTVLCNATQVSFLNLTNSIYPITYTQWYFEGGSPGSSNSFEPTVTYNEPGFYDVQLIVSNGLCTDTLTKENYINKGMIPDAGFGQSSNFGCVPLAVQFTDQTVIDFGTIAAWEWDLGDGTFSDVANPAHTYSVSGNIPVQLIVTSDMGCRDTASNLIPLYTSPLTSAWASEPEICIGDHVDLFASVIDSTAFTYSWLPDATLSCENCLSAIATPTVTTTYTFFSTNASGCSDTSEVTVVVLPYSIPDIAIMADTSICLGESIQLSASDSNGGTSSFDWDESAEGLSCYENCQNPVASPDDTTTYILTVTNIYGCDAQDSVQVAVIDQNQPFAGDDEIICEGDSIQLTLTIAGTPNWLNSNSLSCDDCNDPVAFPQVSTNYVVGLVTADFGCEIFDTILVTVLNQDDIDAGSDLEICVGETISLNGWGPGTVSWNPAEAVSDPNILNPDITPDTTFTYYLTTENGHCILTDSVIISVVDQTIVFLEDHIICYGDTVILEPEGISDTWHWSPAGSLSDPTAETPLAFPLETTTYVLEATQTTCSPGTATSTVVVDPLPNVHVPPVIPFISGQPIEIVVTEYDGRHYKYSWSPADSLSCSSCSNPTFTSSVPMTLEVTVTDLATGCDLVLSVYMDAIEHCDGNLISVPNTFTPNHDGYNDELHLISNTISEINSFKIFDRWGGLVFETDDFYKGWDGQRNGKDMPIGVYVYLIQATCILDGKPFIKKGDVTILR